MNKFIVPLLALCASAVAGAAVTPGAGTPLRRAVLDALRPAVEAKLGPEIEFVVTRLLVENGWAFVQVEPQRKGGRKINGKAYFRTDWEHMDGLTTTAILQYHNKRWNLIESSIGATDAWYCGNRAVAAFAPCS
jgi:hypothetical protein